MSWISGLSEIYLRGDSRHTNRRCASFTKLSFVLCMAGICTRTARVCQVILKDEFVNFPIIEAGTVVEADPRDVETLLNNTTADETAKCALRRRKEINDLFSATSMGKTVELAQSFLRETLTSLLLALVPHNRRRWTSKGWIVVPIG
jgi:hypothetical protein